MIQPKRILERDVLRAVRDYLDAKHILYIRNNSGGAVIERGGKKSFIKFGSIGSPDFLVWKDKQSFGIEIKSSAGKTSPEQDKWRDRFVLEGFQYILARSVEDVEKFL